MTTYIPRDAYEQEIIGAQQQAETARKLREGIVAPQGQMIGNQFVAPSITQHLANILKSYSAGSQERGSAQAIKDAQAGQAQKEQAYIAGMPSPTVTPAVAARTAPVFEDTAASLARALTQGAQTSAPRSMAPTQDNADAMQPNAIAEALRARPQQYSGPIQIGTQDIPAQPEKITQPNIEDYLKYSMNAPNDKMAALVQALGTNRQSAVDKQDAFKAAAELKRETLQQQIEAKKEAQAAQIAQAERESKRDAALRRSLAEMASANKPEKLLTVFDTSTGSPVTIPQSQFQPGMTIYNPATAKEYQGKLEKDKGKQQLSSDLADLVSSYKTLGAGGGAVSSKDGALGNIGARIGASGVGQMLGGAFGTENQTERDKINAMRPMLMQSIKSATGMSAQQMNSDADVKLMMKLTSDPTSSIEANMAILNKLNQKFGLGADIGANPAQPVNSAGGAKGWSVTVHE